MNWDKIYNELVYGSEEEPYLLLVPKQIYEIIKPELDENDKIMLPSGLYKVSIVS